MRGPALLPGVAFSRSLASLLIISIPADQRYTLLCSVIICKFQPENCSERSGIARHHVGIAFRHGVCANLQIFIIC